ncbi:MAG: HD domain-containing protein [bacterium]
MAPVLKKNIVEIYERYRIPPWLALHMYRVAAVGAMLFDAQTPRVGGENERAELIMACLLHDMGNIIKFDLDKLPSPVRTERDHWETVRSDMISRYGRDEHKATLAILDEIGVSNRVREIIDSIGFLKNAETNEHGDILTKIAVYADSRVVPNGVASLEERMTDMHERYSDQHPKDEPLTIKNRNAIYAIEKELFANASIRPEAITEQSIAVLRDGMKAFDIVCPLG